MSVAVAKLVEATISRKHRTDCPVVAFMAPRSAKASIEAVVRGLIIRWNQESRLTKYLTPEDEQQLVDIALHAYDLGKSESEAKP